MRLHFTYPFVDSRRATGRAAPSVFVFFSSAERCRFLDKDLHIHLVIHIIHRVIHKNGAENPAFLLFMHMCRRAYQGVYTGCIHTHFAVWRRKKDKLFLTFTEQFLNVYFYTNARAGTALRSHPLRSPRKKCRRAASAIITALSVHSPLSGRYRRSPSRRAICCAA